MTDKERALVVAAGLVSDIAGAIEAAFAKVRAEMLEEAEQVADRWLSNCGDVEMDSPAPMEIVAIGLRNRLAQVRAETLEEAAQVADRWLADWGAIEIDSPARPYACEVVADISEAIRALARTPGTGGGE